MKRQWKMRNGNATRACAYLLAILAGLHDVQVLGATDLDIEFEPAKPTFGVVRRALDEDLVLDVTVRNRGGDRVDIGHVQIGCGCMQVEVLGSSLVASGGSGQIRITLDHHRARVGRVSYPLTILNGSQPLASVPVTLTYDPPVYAEHSELFIDAEKPAGAMTTTTVRVRQPRIPDVEPQVECDSPHFSASLRKIAESQPGEYQLEVRFGADPPRIGNTRAAVTVRLAGSPAPDLTLPVHCVIRAPVSARPAVVLFKDLLVGKEVRRAIRLTSKVPFTVKSVATSSRDVKVVERDPGTGRRLSDPLIERTYELVVRPADAGVGAFTADIQFDIESPVGFRLVVPVVGEILDDASEE